MTRYVANFTRSHKPNLLGPLNQQVRRGSYVANFTRSRHRPFLTQGLLSYTARRNTNFWVSPSKLYNYMNNDTLVDWLNVHCGKSKNKRRVQNEFTQFLMDKGCEFETEVIKYINDNCVPVVTVSDKITNKTVALTKKYMREGAPVIHSAPVRNTENYTRGVIDLLVRSDYLHHIIQETYLQEHDITHSAPKLGLENYHYVVIDIKFSTLPLRADGQHLLNRDRYAYYKSQLCIYNEAVSAIQGYLPRYAFIMGRRWNYISQGIKYSNNSCNDRLGMVDFEGVDLDYVEKTRKAIEWVRSVNKNGKTWKIDPPSREELFPNMCTESGYWDKKKKELAEKNGEITSIWYCGVKNRSMALKNGIQSWKDENCTAEAMGIRGVRAPVINKIMEFNRSAGDNEYIYPKKVTNNTHDWRNESVPEVFVDFETMLDIFSDMSQIPLQKKTEMIFMIGVSYRDPTTGERLYHNFTCLENTPDEELRIMREFVAFLQKLGNPKIWYWYAEDKFWNSASDRQINRINIDQEEHLFFEMRDNWELEFTDLHDIFTREPIVLKGCYNFKLKNIAYFMKKYGMIDIQLSSECSSGNIAAVKAWKTYNRYDKTEILQSDTMKDIIKYNKFDVLVMEEMLTYLRKTH